MRARSGSPRQAGRVVGLNLSGIGTPTRLADRVVALVSWRQACAAFACGAVSVLAMAPFFVTPILFLTLPALIWLIDSAGPVRSAVASAGRAGGMDWPRLRHAAIIGWCFGFGYFVAGWYWIGAAFLVEADKFAVLMPFAVGGLAAWQALYIAIATAAATFLWRPGLSRVLVLALALSAADWLRGHLLTGFPWNLFGYALTQPLALMQSAALVGVYGLSLLAVVVFAAPAVAWVDADRAGSGGWRRLLGCGLACAIVAVLTVGGLVRLATSDPPDVAGVRLRLVQPSIPQTEKWRPEKQRDIFLDHLALSAQEPGGGRDDLQGITHLVWAEAAMPFLPLDQPEALEAIGRLLPDGTYLLAGALRVEPIAGAGQRRHAFNSLIVLDDKGALVTLYDKIHLVPFGEYLPFQKSLESIGLEQITRWRGGFSIGPTPRPLLKIAGLPPLAILICYEAIFPSAAVQGDARPAALLNVTNDGWFGNTTGPYQHYHQARVRAVEEGLPLVRNANNGVSAVIDAKGRVLASLGLNARGVIDSPLPGAGPPTPYARHGDRLFAVAWICILCSLLWVGRTHGKRE